MIIYIYIYLYKHIIINVLFMNKKDYKLYFSIIYE